MDVINSTNLESIKDFIKGLKKPVNMPCYLFYAGNYRFIVYNSNSYGNSSVELDKFENVSLTIYKENVFNEEPIHQIHPKHNDMWMNFFNSIRWTSDETTFQLMKFMPISTLCEIVKFCCFISEISVFE